MLLFNHQSESDLRKSDKGKARHVFSRSTVSLAQFVSFYLCIQGPDVWESGGVFLCCNNCAETTSRHLLLLLAIPFFPSSSFPPSFVVH